MKTIREPATESSCKTAGEILKNGGIVAFPTDTVYGLGAVFSDTNAVKKIFEAKGRDEGKPLSILVSDASQVESLAESIPEAARKLMKEFWPGALTIIVTKKSIVPTEVAAGGTTVGIRMPASQVALDIIRAAGAPLAAPSANTSGKRSSVSADDVSEDLNGKIDMIIDGGLCDLKVASTVVDMTGDRPGILREGIISEEMINRICGERRSI